jgi:transglutaminase-like putative cysteine protease
VIVPPNTNTPAAPRSRWRPERPSSTSALLYVTVTFAVIVGCLSTLRLFVGAGFAALIAVSVLLAIWVPYVVRLARIPWIVGVIASASAETWLLLRWAADNTQGILTPATPTNPSPSGVSIGSVQRATVETLPRISTAIHRFGTLPPFKIPGDRVSLVAAGKLVKEALLQVNVIVAPAPMLVGFGLVVAVVAWIVGTLTEVFLGSFRARFEALLPMSVAAVASALLISHTSDPYRVRWVAAVGATCALHGVAVAALERRYLSNWFTGSKPHALRSAIVALGVLGMIGAASVRIVERLNVNRRESVIDWRVSQQQTPRGPTSITSPLASMQRQLLQQSNLEQFRVKALANGQPLASYWRQTSLSKFVAGEEWKGSGSYRRVKASEELITSSETSSATDGVVLDQEVEIGALPNDQLPVAWEARSVTVLASNNPSVDAQSTIDRTPTLSANTTPDTPSELDGVGERLEDSPSTSTTQPKPRGSIPPKPVLSFDEQSLTLLSAKHPRPGQRYRVRSVVRRAVPDDVAAASVATDPADPELELPALPERVKALAERITLSETSTVAKAKALQDYLRANYTYSLEVPETTVDSPLEDFLFESKVGYCVQFAGAFTVLARSVGIPARLALGYTPGKLTEDGYFSVTGKNAHAWPEVRLSDNRWVAFEPTPGRGNPDGEAITGVAGIDGPEAPESTAATTTSTTVVASELAVPTVPETATTPEIPTAINEKSSSTRALLLAALLALAAMVGTAIWLTRRRRESTIIVTERTRRTLRSQDPAEQIDALWVRVERRLGQTLSPRGNQETEIAFADRAAALVPQVPALALLTQRARYATPAMVNTADATTALQLAESIDLALHHQLTGIAS